MYNEIYFIKIELLVAFCGIWDIYVGALRINDFIGQYCFDFVIPSPNNVGWYQINLNGKTNYLL